jgi:tripartite-type tricarboxylate transporter receptor subunit TctC
MRAPFATFLACLMLAISASAHAQPYPSKGIKIVVPFAVGGIADTFGRVIAQKLSETWGQPVVVENKTGAGGNIGADLVAKSPPDGYTVVIGNIGTHAVTPFLVKSMPYDPIKDFVPVAHVLDAEGLLVVHPSLPVKTVPELIAYAKANPGKLAYGSAGSGSLPHLGTELFKAQTGTDMIHVPYKGGGPMVTDLLGGSVQMVIADQANLMPHVQAGKLRALAVATPKRSPNEPDLPTIAETGLAGYDATAWQGLVGPAGLPPEVVKRLNDAFNKAMAIPAVREKLLGGGLEPVGGTPEQFATFIGSEIAKWTRIAKDVGAKAE